MSETEFIPLNLDLQQVITTEQAWHYGIVPKQIEKSAFHFYIDEQRFSKNLNAELELLLGKGVVLEKASSDLIQRTLGKYYRKTSDSAIKRKEFVYNQKGDFLESLIREAKELGSSDIHLEAYEEKCRIRFRIDGLLIERFNIAKSEYPSLVNKIKIQANLDISEKRLPQDGRIFFHSGGHKFDIRASVLPSLHGEKIVLRLLSNDAANVDINALGFTKEELDRYLEGVRSPHGIVLISGPTGSGKTTTLYATLKVLNKTTNNIVTIEDPIEYTLDGINQVQLKESIGLSFASALRTFLRQDPDIIMLGEIRDTETAQMAVRASLTGHLVLSTIHTNSAWGTITRLIDMGVPSYLVAGTLNTSVAQRLIRTLCPVCKERHDFDPGLYPRQFRPGITVMQHFLPKGCDHCHYTGYKGRKAIYEVIPIDFELAESIKNNIFTVQDKLRERGIRSLAENAHSLFASGQTSLDEVYALLMNPF